MRVTLEIVAGPQSGRKLVVGGGYVVQVGRTEWADFAVPDDAQMSSVHFKVECGQQECRIRDLRSTNGTRVNGHTISEAILQDQDEIDAGQTHFVVHVESGVPSAPPAPANPRTTQVLTVEGTGGQGLGVGEEGPSRPAATPQLRTPIPESPSLVPTPQPPTPSPHRPASPPVLRQASPLKQTIPAAAAVPSERQGTRVVLETVGGPCAKQIVALRTGQVVRVGRTEWAELAFPLDREMSSLHFSLENDRGVCRLRDLNSTNGTLVNGNRVAETVLADGDSIRAGQTTLVVHIEGALQSPSTSPQGPAECFRAAMADEDPAVRREALLAAVWTRQPWVMEHCRKLCAQPSPEHWDAILTLAILGRPQDLPRIMTIGRATDLGPRRFEALGAYGHPAVVDVLLEAMAGEDAEAAVAAAIAFTKISGPLDQPVPPDPRRARAHWDRVKSKISQRTRSCCGLDLTEKATEETLAQLDMQSRWETICREQFEGTCARSLVELEAVKIP